VEGEFTTETSAVHGHDTLGKQDTQSMTATILLDDIKLELVALRAPE
jgi:hypothetical protein